MCIITVTTPPQTPPTRLCSPGVDGHTSCSAGRTVVTLAPPLLAARPVDGAVTLGTHLMMAGLMHHSAP